MKNFIKRKNNINAIIFGGFAMFAAIVITAQIPVHAASTFPHVYELVSVNNVDGQGVNYDARVQGVSADGNKILFSTKATNLPDAVTTSLQSGGYIRDISLDTTTRIDLSESGVVPDRLTAGHTMSKTGRYIAFTSTASNIIDGSTLSDTSRVYFKDLQTNTVDIIPSVLGGPISVSDDGRYILISTSNINSVIPGTRTGSGYIDIVLYDRVKLDWTLINKPIDETMQNVSTFSNYYKGGSASCDGSLIVFNSAATNLTDDHSGSGKHVFLADIRNGLHVVDLTPGATADSVNPEISCNGRYIIYSTKDRTVVTPTPSGMSAYAHLVRYDRLTGERKYIDSNSAGTTFDKYQADQIPSSVTDLGDVVLMYSSDTSPYNRKVYFKHLSDGSGTLESVQHNYAGLYYTPDKSPSFMVSSNGKYLAASSKEGYNLGVLSSPSSAYDILRIKTGL